MFVGGVDVDLADVGAAANAMVAVAEVDEQVLCEASTGATERGAVGR
jgi:hypothetical protein